MNTDVYNLQNEKVGTMELPAAVFGLRWNETLVKQVVLAQSANKRDPWAHAKGRGEVRGGGKKPWRQKGTGRARQGSTRSPLWVGGGKSHGPNKERDYSQKVNKKMKRRALFTVLSRKLKDGEVKIFDSFVLEAPKTKFLATALRPMLGMKNDAKRYNVLLVPAAISANKNLVRASANLTKLKTLDAMSLNVQDVMDHKNFFIEKDAIGTIIKHFSAEKPVEAPKAAKAAKAAK